MIIARQINFVLDLSPIIQVCMGPESVQNVRFYFNSFLELVQIRQFLCQK